MMDSMSAAQQQLDDLRKVAEQTNAINENYLKYFRTHIFLWVVLLLSLSLLPPGAALLTFLGYLGLSWWLSVKSGEGKISPKLKRRLYLISIPLGLIAFLTWQGALRMGLVVYSPVFLVPYAVLLLVVGYFQIRHLERWWAKQQTELI